MFWKQHYNNTGSWSASNDCKSPNNIITTFGFVFFFNSKNSNFNAYRALLQLFLTDPNICENLNDRFSCRKTSTLRRTLRHISISKCIGNVIPGCIVHFVNRHMIFSLIRHVTQVLISTWQSTPRVLIIRHERFIRSLRSSRLALPSVFVSDQSISCHYTANDALSSACTVWLIVLLRSRLMTWWENYWSNDLGRRTAGRRINK